MGYNNIYDIKELRELYGISRQALAKEIGYSYVALSRVEEHRWVPSYKMCFKLGNYFDIDPVKILRYYRSKSKPFHNTNYIFDLRMKNGKTPKEIAYYLGVSVSSYYRIEQGSQALSDDLIQRLIVIYNVDYDEFMENLKPDNKRR